MIDISIIIPTHNSEKYIQQTLGSVVGSGFNGSVYISDGGSKDSTIEIINRFKTLLSIQICSETDNGQSDGVNKALSFVKSEFVLWLNSDDVIYPTFFSDFSYFINSYKKQYYFYTADHIEFNKKGSFKNIFGGDQYKAHASKAIWRGDFPCIIWRVDAIKSVQGLNTDLHYNMDQDLVKKIAQNSSQFKLSKHLNKTLGGFRFHEGSKTTGVEYAKSLDSVKDYFKLNKITKKDQIIAKLIYIIMSPRVLIKKIFFKIL